MLFSLFADESAIGRTLTGLRSRNYTAPADKYTDEMKTAVPQGGALCLSGNCPTTPTVQNSLASHVCENASLALICIGIMRPVLCSAPSIS